MFLANSKRSAWLKRRIEAELTQNSGGGSLVFRQLEFFGTWFAVVQATGGARSNHF